MRWTRRGFLGVVLAAVGAAFLPRACKRAAAAEVSDVRVGDGLLLSRERAEAMLRELGRQHAAPSVLLQARQEGESMWFAHRYRVDGGHWTHVWDVRP